MEEDTVKIIEGQIWESKETPGKYILIRHISINTIDSIDFAYKTVFYFYCTKDGKDGKEAQCYHKMMGQLPYGAILKSFRVVNDQETLIGMVEESFNNMTDGF